MIDKYWIKFNDLYVDCMCPFEDKKCRLEGDKPKCKLYVAKFIDVTKEFEIDEKTKAIEKAIKDLEVGSNLQKKITNQFKKNASELQKSIRKFKI
jgi:hypothetical protein